jgi:hypothetical protein
MIGTISAQRLRTVLRYRGSMCVGNINRTLAPDGRSYLFLSRATAPFDQNQKSKTPHGCQNTSKAYIKGIFKKRSPIHREEKGGDEKASPWPWAMHGPMAHKIRKNLILCYLCATGRCTYSSSAITHSTGCIVIGHTVHPDDRNWIVRTATTRVPMHEIWLHHHDEEAQSG